MRRSVLSRDFFKEWDVGFNMATTHRNPIMKMIIGYQSLAPPNKKEVFRDGRLQVWEFEYIRVLVLIVWVMGMGVFEVPGLRVLAL